MDTDSFLGICTYPVPYLLGYAALNPKSHPISLKLLLHRLNGDERVKQTNRYHPSYHSRTLNQSTSSALYKPLQLHTTLYTTNEKKKIQSSENNMTLVLIS